MEEKKTDQHSRQMFLEEQLLALVQEEKSLNETFSLLQNQRWQLVAENEKLNQMLEQSMGLNQQQQNHQMNHHQL